MAQEVRDQPLNAFRSTALVSFLVFAPLGFLSLAFSQAPQSHADWQAFERKVRDGAISCQEGEKAVAEWAERLERWFPQARFPKKTFFPLRLTPLSRPQNWKNKVDAPALNIDS